MPLLTTSNIGAKTVVSGMVNETRQLTLANAEAFTLGNLACDQLPNLVFYAFQTAGAAQASISCEFSLRQTEGAITPDFRLLQTLVLPATPVILNFQLPCNFIRMTGTSAANATVINVVIAAFAP